MPYAVLEALALSRVCVVTKVDGNKDVVKNNYNGFTVPPKASEIAEKIIIIWNNEEKRKKMEENSRKIFEQFFKIDKNIHLLEKIYTTTAMRKR